MKNTLKKIMALGLAGAMMMGMSVSAMAEAGAGNWLETSTSNAVTTQNQEKVWNNEDGITNISFKVFYNEGGANRVKTGFKLATTAGTAKAATASTLAIKAGDLTGIGYQAAADVVRVDDATGLDTATVLFAANDTSDNKDVTLTFDPTAFADTGAGVYRYVITETITTEMAALGIKATEGTARYLDVYVENGATDGTYKITNVVMTKTEQDPTLTDNRPAGEADGVYDLATYTDKVNSIKNTVGNKKDPEDPGNTTDPEDDVYGYSFHLKKKVQGGMGDQSEFFPFQIKLSYTDDTADTDTTLEGYEVQLQFDDGSKSVSSATALTFGANNTVESGVNDLQIKHGGTIIIKGIPATVKVEVKELVDANESYLLSSAVENVDNGVAVAATEKLHTETAYKTTGTIKIDETKVGTATYTNNRNAISPTGVVLRFAPYVILLGAALAVLMATRRRRAH